MFPELIVDATEQVTTIPVAETSAAAVRTVIFSVSVPNLQTGDIVSLKSQFECSNKLGFNVALDRYLVRTDTRTGTIGNIVVPNGGGTITPDMHHEVCVLVGNDQIDAHGSYCYNVVAYAYSDNDSTDKTLLVMQNYGKLWAVVYRQNP